MIALLTDEDLNGRIVRGLLRRIPALDLVTSNQVGLHGKPDSQVIAWAAEHGRVLITHDVNTMIAAALDRLRAGEAMAGVIAVPQHLAIGAVVTDLELVVGASEAGELDRQIWYLPL